MMAGMQQRPVICTAVFFLFIFSPVLSLSAEGEGLEGYHHHLITRSRQETGWTNHGTEIFLAPEVKGDVDQYSDEELGNYVVKRHSHVRKVHVCLRITGDLELNHDLRLGMVEVEDGARVREIENQEKLRYIPTSLTIGLDVIIPDAVGHRVLLDNPGGIDLHPEHGIDAVLSADIL